MAKAEAVAARLPDAEARRAIEEDLGVSLLVEAAAGTGKTTSLVARMTELIRSGATTVDRISAVTFTIKAAAELSERFQTSLEAAARDGRGRGEAATGEPRSRGSTPPSSARSTRSARACSASGPSRRAWTRVSPRWTSPRTPPPGSRPGTGTPSGSSRATARSSRASPRSTSDSRTSARPTRRCRTTRTSRRRSGREQPPPDFAAERAAVSGVSVRAAADLPAEMPPGGWTEYQEAVRRAARLVALRDTSDAPAFAPGPRCAPSRAARKATEAGRLRNEFETLCRDVLAPGLERAGASTFTRS